MKVADKKNSKEFSRRDFLKTSGAVTGGFIGGSLLGGLVGFNFETIEDVIDDTSTAEANTDTADDGQSADNNLEARMFFKRKDDFDTLSAVTEVIFPEDDNGPGAIGLGVPFFIDRQLAGTWGINERMYMQGPFQEGEIPLIKQEIFLQGIRKIEEESQNDFDNSFIELNEDQQIEILERFEADDVEMDLITSSQFFQILRQSTLEGAYSDPLYGGNKGMEGWKMKEYPGAQLSYRHLMTEDHTVDSEYVVIEPMSLSDQ